MDSRGQTQDGLSPKTSQSDDGSAVSVVRLREATEAILRGDDTRADLDAAAAQLVSELRETNLAPEQMLLKIKRILADAGLRASQNDPSQQTDVLSVVYREVIALCIRHYYRGKGEG